MTHAINIVISILLTLAGLVLEAIGVADGFLAASMSAAGVPPQLQIIILIIVAVLLVVFALRLLGGVFGLLLLVLLILLLAHRLPPALQVPHAMLPQQWQQFGSVHI